MKSTCLNQIHCTMIHKNWCSKWYSSSDEAVIVLSYNCFTLVLNLGPLLSGSRHFEGYSQKNFKPLAFSLSEKTFVGIFDQILFLAFWFVKRRKNSFSDIEFLPDHITFSLSNYYEFNICNKSYIKLLDLKIWQINEVNFKLSIFFIEWVR